MPAVSMNKDLMETANCSLFEVGKLVFSLTKKETMMQLVALKTIDFGDDIQYFSCLEILGDIWAQVWM